MRRTNKDDRDLMRKLRKRGWGLRRIAKETGFSHMTVKYALGLKKPAAALSEIEEKLAALERDGVKEYGIERQGGRFKIVNWGMPLSTNNETREYSRLSGAVAEAIRIWT